MKTTNCQNEGCSNGVTQTEGKRERIYCSDKCRMSAYLKKKKPATSVQLQTYQDALDKIKELEQRVQELTKINEETKPVEAPKPNHALKRPTTLDELKMLIPESLSGLEKSEWIAKARQIFGI